ncbi:MAG: sigma-70 family RNA polymerase sigma factor [Rhodocyclaceae bacterium]|nr:sigma-70 family RNA polymerase sigma factor [Rhodocyclaceae bacterium]
MQAGNGDGAKSQIDAQFLGDIRRDMIKFAQLQLRDAAQAEDVVQEALLAVLNKPQSFAGRSAVKTWVFGILKNKIVDLIRLQVRTTNVSALSAAEESMDQAFDTLFKTNAHWQPGGRPSDWGNPEEALRQQRFWDVFDACLKHLPEKTARVFMMREFLEFETAEVCRELSLTTTNCNVILHRARNGLRRCLEGNWFAPGERAC